jgi:carbamoyl-phosphate synthase small subunit
MGGILLLEDGRKFEGESFGARATAVGEVVFNTSMTGYQEVLTDPSYREQIVTMTVPHVGNYGVNAEDVESGEVQVAGFVARSFSRMYSSHRAEEGLDRYLKRNGIPGLQGLDTRALVRHIRNKGAMKAVISTDGSTVAELQARIDDWPGMEGRALAQEVSTDQPYLFADPVSPVFPALTPAEVLRESADMVFLSNGPGDPAALPEMVTEIKKLVGQVPIVGICLGHQLLGLALEADTFKLQFGHRGGNHPVRDEETGAIEITSQNHGFCVDPVGIEAAGGRVTHVNLNDGTLEGFVQEDLGVMAVQFHPEASPGPHDSRHLLIDRFLRFGGADMPGPA